MMGCRPNQLLIAGTALAILMATSPAAGPIPQLKATRTRTYVKGYKVQDGFAIPVIGTTTEGATMTATAVISRGGRTQRQEPEYLLRDPKKAPEGSLDAIEKSAEQAEAKETVRKVTARGQGYGPRTTTLVGTLARTGKGQLSFIVGDGSKPSVYDLLTPEPAIELLAKANAETVHAVLIGQVNSADETPTLRVGSGWLLKPVTN